MVELCCCWILNRFWNTLRIRHNSIWSLGVSFHRICLVYFFLHRLNYFRFSNISYTLTEWHALYLLLLFHWWEEKRRGREKKYEEKVSIVSAPSAHTYTLELVVSIEKCMNRTIVMLSYLLSIRCVRFARASTDSQ